MLTVLTAIGFFLLSAIAHGWFCRRQKQGGLFVKVFCVIAAVNLGLCWLVFMNYENGRHPSFWDIPLVVSSTVIYVLLVPAYMVFYVSTQLNSPSKTVLLALHAHGEMSEEDLLKYFTDDLYILPRIKDLVLTGCIDIDSKGKYVLSSSGLRIAGFLNAYQIFLGRKAGG